MFVPLSSKKNKNMPNGPVRKSNLSLERPQYQSKYGLKKLSDLANDRTQSKERKSILESQGRKIGRQESSIGKSPVSKISKNTYLCGHSGGAAG
jgi:hypothetical protein